MTVHVDGRVFKQFHAKDPITKSIQAKTRSRSCVTAATAATATDFLHEVLQRMPVHSVQVDGGYGVLKEFETARRDAGIPLHVLPPRRPDINGGVERSNRTLRSGFWSIHRGDLTISAVNRALDRHLHDHVRPHHALGLLTPAKFADKLSLAA